MADQLQVLFSQEDFLSLANRAGFALSQADLAHLTRRKLLRPWQQPDTGAESFHLLHLFLLVRYFEAVRPIRHPWATVAPELTLQDINQQSRECHDCVAQLIDDEVSLNPDVLNQWGRAARDHAEKINPFGPLTGVVDLLAAHGQDALRGDGLLYVRLLELADGLDSLVASESPALSDVDETVAELEGAGQEEARQEEARQEEARQEDVVLRDVHPADISEEIQLTEKIELDDEDELEDEQATAADEEGVRNPFSRHHSEVTTRSSDLQSRLDQLRNHDKEVARKRARTPDRPAEATSRPADDAAKPEADAGKPENVHARIEELNRLREKYLADQRWEDLAALYEDGIELFVEPVERQQVYLTLAMLYEVKLERLDDAFDRFVAAYCEKGAQQAKDKALKGLQRLGRLPSLQARYIGFLDQLADNFEDEELSDFYAELLSSRLPDAVFESVAVRAASHHVAQGEIGMGMEYFERIIERLPTHEVAFHSLAQLYEDAGRLARLVELYQIRMEALGDQAPAALRSELQRIQALVHTAKATE